MRTSRGLRARLRGLRLDDRGISTLEVLIMFPILVISMFMAIQVAMDYYAKEVAFAAAERGVQVARMTGNPQDGKDAAWEYMHKHAGWLVTNDTGIDTSRSTATTMIVTVKGTPVTVIGPLASIVTVVETSQGSIEQFTTMSSQP